MRLRLLEINMIQLKKLALAGFCLGALSSGYSQTTITLQPDGVTGKDATINSSSQSSSTNYGNQLRMPARVIMRNGNTTFLRGLIDFDLNQVPANVVITDAKLTLTPPNGLSIHLSGSNDLLISKISANWDEQLVTWDNQPQIDPTIQTTLAASNLASSYQNIDVTDHIIDKYYYPSSNFGMRLTMANEVAPAKATNFASSDATNSSIRPKLDITYSPLEIQLCGATGIKAADEFTVPSLPGPVTYTYRLYNNQHGLLDTYTSNTPNFNLSHFSNVIIAPYTKYYVSAQITNAQGLNIQGDQCDITTGVYLKPQNPYMAIGQYYWDSTLR